MGRVQCTALGGFSARHGAGSVHGMGRECWLLIRRQYAPLAVQVGAATETELKDKKLRYEDALNSVKAAMAEGVVPVRPTPHPQKCV